MTKATKPGEPYEPADHTVDEVKEYLDGADDAERDRVLAAERAGKDRATIAAVAEPETPDPAAPGTPPAEEERPGSEEVQAVPEVTEEPVRRDGWVLTDDGWKPDTGAGPAGLPPGSGAPENPTPAAHEGRDD